MSMKSDKEESLKKAADKEILRKAAEILKEKYSDLSKDDYGFKRHFEW